MNYTVLQTAEFETFLAEVRDQKALGAIIGRIERMKLGLLGTIRTVNDGVSEAKVDVGAGYRLYFTIRRREVVILLCGGDKSSQSRDIKLAKKIAQLY